MSHAGERKVPADDCFLEKPASHSSIFGPSGTCWGCRAGGMGAMLLDSVWVLGKQGECSQVGDAAPWLSAWPRCPPPLQLRFPIVLPQIHPLPTTGTGAIAALLSPAMLGTFLSLPTSRGTSWARGVWGVLSFLSSLSQGCGSVLGGLSCNQGPPCLVAPWC